MKILNTGISFIVALLALGCSPRNQVNLDDLPTSPYTDGLVATRQFYPFTTWRGYVSNLPQYTGRNCTHAENIFDQLIATLATLGSDASESAKLAAFREAIVALNQLNEETDYMLIETDERELLCELTNKVAIAAGLDPSQYGDGEGPASEWRDW